MPNSSSVFLGIDIWESIKSISNVSNFVLKKTDNYFIYSQISQIINKISISCFEKMKDVFYSEIINIYFNQIKISWNRYEHNDILWKNLFEELKKSILLFSVIESNLDLSISNLLIDFQAWQVNIANWIIGMKEEKEKKENLDKFMLLLKRWSDFLLDFARDNGLQEKKVGLSIIQSVGNNINIIYGIKNKFSDIDLKKLYETQFNTLSWYFQKTDKVEKSTLFNLEQTLETLLKEISYNLKHGVFEINELINLYVRLVEAHFEKVVSGNGKVYPLSRQ